MKRNQVFVRAYDGAGRIGNADVLDLDEESFRAFLVSTLMRWGAVTSIRDEHVEGEHVKLRLKPGLMHDKEEMDH